MDNTPEDASSGAGAGAGAGGQDGGRPRPDAAGMPPDALSITAAEDILAFVPHLLGFVPSDSLVLLGLRGTRLGPALRMDLPAEGPPRGYAREAIRLLRGDSRTDGLLVVVYAPEADTGPGGRWFLLPSQLSEEAGRAGLVVRDGWTVGRDRWRSCFCRDPSCCPESGQDTAALDGTRLSAEMVYRGSVAADNPASALDRDLAVAAARLLPPGPAAPADVVGRTHPSSGAPSSGRPSSDRAEPVQDLPAGWWQHAAVLPRVLAAWDTALAEAGSGRAPAPGPAGMLRSSLTSRTVRDLLPVMMAAGCAEALTGARRAGLMSQGPVPAAVLLLLPERSRPVPDGPPADADGGRSGGGVQGAGEDMGGDLLARILTGRWTGQPDWERIDNGFALLAWLDATAEAAGADHASGAGRWGKPSPGPGPVIPAAPAIPALLAWIEWARGRGSRAQVLLERCLQRDPGYRLALLMQELFATGAVPLWAQSERTAWERRQEPVRS